MIGRNVDIIAVAILLFGVAVFTHAHGVLIFDENQTRGIRFGPNGPHYRPLIIKRDIPRMPFERD